MLYFYEIVILRHKDYTCRNLVSMLLKEDGDFRQNVGIELNLTMFMFNYIQNIIAISLIQGTENKNSSMFGSLLWKLESIQKR